MIEAELGAYPDRAIRVFVEGQDVIIGQCARITRFVLKNRKTVSIISVQPVLRAEP